MAGAFLQRERNSPVLMHRSVLLQMCQPSEQCPLKVSLEIGRAQVFLSEEPVKCKERAGGGPRR